MARAGRSSANRAPAPRTSRRGRTWLGTGLRRGARARPRRAAGVRRAPPRDVVGRGRDVDRVGAAHRTAAAADPGGARLRPLDRRFLRTDPEGDHARHGVRRLPRPVGRRPTPSGGAGPPDRGVLVDGPARRGRHHLRRPRLGAEDHRAPRRHRTSTPPSRSPRGPDSPSTSATRARPWTRSSPRSVPAAGPSPTRSSPPGCGPSPFPSVTAPAPSAPP